MHPHREQIREDRKADGSETCAFAATPMQADHHQHCKRGKKIQVPANLDAAPEGMFEERPAEKGQRRHGLFVVSDFFDRRRPVCGEVNGEFPELMFVGIEWKGEAAGIKPSCHVDQQDGGDEARTRKKLGSR